MFEILGKVIPEAIKKQTAPSTNGTEDGKKNVLTRHIH